jgi:trk system potassium uptake protein TrkA
MNIVILGCGRVGSTLARTLTAENVRVTVLDISADSFRRLGAKYKGQKVVGNGLDQDVLKRAGLETATAFIAVTQGDNTNIMAAQIARNVFNINKVLVRLYDPIRAEAYRELGFQTICTTSLVSGLLRSALIEDENSKTCRTFLEDLDHQVRALID